jgi:DNA-directed RNA polymerase subunit RPC12/RpoP
MLKKSRRRDKKVLVGPWRQAHTAIWLIGLAVLFWKGWWWPGILVLVALSMLAEAVIWQIPGAAVPKEEIFEPDFEEFPADEPAGTAPAKPDPTKLPEKCQECGAPVSADDVRWTSAATASCPYCGANLRMKD